MDFFTIPDDGSLVRVFHAVPNAPAVDVYVNDNLAFHNINFRQFTNYIPLAAGDYSITLYVVGTTEPTLLSVTLTVPLGGIFTTAATGNLHDLQLLVLDDMAANGNEHNNSQLRMVHLAPNAPDVTIQIDNMPFVEDIGFREMTPYALIPPGSYVITLTKEDYVLLTFRIQLRDQLISTVYIIGDTNGLGALLSIDGSSYLCNTAQATT